MKNDVDKCYKIVIAILLALILISTILDVFTFIKYDKIQKSEKGKSNFYFLNVKHCNQTNETETTCWAGINETFDFKIYGFFLNKPNTGKLILKEISKKK